MEEILDIYTIEGEYLGTRTREECHQKNPGFYHKPVWIWIVNSKNEILVQKRASVKKSFPNYTTFSFIFQCFKVMYCHIF